jgi:hypothetical protein
MCPCIPWNDDLVIHRILSHHCKRTDIPGFTSSKSRQQMDSQVIVEVIEK